MSPDVAIVGGGIIGCTAAALLAERGASVMLLEARTIGAGASGRNSGAVQHPFHPTLQPLHEETLDGYRALDGLDFPREPAGLLLLTDDPVAAEARVADLRREAPFLRPELLDEEGARAAEPLLGRGLLAIRLATGHPIPPDAATMAMARRAERTGAVLRIGTEVTGLVEEGDRVAGVRLADGSRIAAGQTLVAAGPWTPSIVDTSGSWRPLRPTHGVTVQVALRRSGPVLEEGVVHTINAPVDADLAFDLASTFSLVSVGPTSTVGSTFLPVAPDAEEIAPRVVARAARFMPAVAGVPVLARRVCTRPQSTDGLPLIGAPDGRAGLLVCTGHGPWGISIGPATARLAVDLLLGGAAISPELAAARRLG